MNVGALLVGALIAAVGGWSFLKERRLHRRGSRTTGRVADMRYEPNVRDGSNAALADGSFVPGGSRMGQYYPVLEFRTANGQLMQAVSRIGSSVPPAMTGDRVRVLYDPANPAVAEIDESTVRTAWWPALVGFVGILIMLGAFARK